MVIEQAGYFSHDLIQLDDLLVALLIGRTDPFSATPMPKTIPTSLSQSHYIDFLLDKYGLMDANPVSTPMDPNVKFEMNVKKDDDRSEAKEDPKLGHSYAQLIGSLMYLALASRPNIAYAVNRLAQFTSNQKKNYALDSCEKNI